MMGFERVIDFVFDAWDNARPWVVVDPYEQGLVFTLGRPFRRGLRGDMVITNRNGWFGTGLHLKVPFIERDSMALTAIRTTRLSGQSLTTKDGIDVCVTTATRFKVKNVIPLLTEITGTDDVLKDSIAMTVAEIVTTTDWHKLQENSVISELFLQEIRKKLNQYGFKILQATFVDLIQAPATRLIIPEEYTVKRDD